MNKLRLKSNLPSAPNGAGAGWKGLFRNWSGQEQALDGHIWRKGARRLGFGAFLVIGLSFRFLPFSTTVGPTAAKAAEATQVTEASEEAKATKATQAMQAMQAMQATQAASPTKSQDQHQAYNLTVTVRNPRCPSCLKALKTYLLTQNGVSGVFVDSITSSAPRIVIKIKLELPAERTRLIEHIRARDFEILSIAP